jgi:hypothetical protein
MGRIQIRFDRMTLSIGVDDPIRYGCITGLTSFKGTEDPNVHGTIRGVIVRYYRYS